MAKKLPKTLNTPARQKRLLALLEEYVVSSCGSKFRSRCCRGGGFRKSFCSNRPRLPGALPQRTPPSSLWAACGSPMPACSTPRAALNARLHPQTQESERWGKALRARPRGPGQGRRGHAKGVRIQTATGRPGTACRRERQRPSPEGCKHTHARTHTHTRAHTHAHTHARTYARTRTHTHAHARTHTHARTHKTTKTPPAGPTADTCVFRPERQP